MAMLLTCNLHDICTVLNYASCLIMIYSDEQTTNLMTMVIYYIYIDREREISYPNKTIFCPETGNYFEFFFSFFFFFNSQLMSKKRNR